MPRRAPPDTLRGSSWRAATSRRPTPVWRRHIPRRVPVAQIVLTDPSLPLRVRLEAFNPLIATDPDRSGIPVAILRFVVHNMGANDCDASIAGGIQNFIGRDNPVNDITQNRNQSCSAGKLTGVQMDSDELDPTSERWVTIALATYDDGSRITTREAWADVTWGDSLLDFWDDFLDDGCLDNREQGTVTQPIASVAAATSIPAGSNHTFPFVIGWHFPNRQSRDFRDANIVPVGNYYAT